MIVTIGGSTDASLYNDGYLEGNPSLGDRYHTRALGGSTDASLYNDGYLEGDPSLGCRYRTRPHMQVAARMPRHMAGAPPVGGVQGAGAQTPHALECEDVQLRIVRTYYVKIWDPHFNTLVWFTLSFQDLCSIDVV